MKQHLEAASAHRTHAHDCTNIVAINAPADSSVQAAFWNGVLAALMALVHLSLAQLIELRRIRKRLDSRTIQFNLTAAAIPKSTEGAGHAGHHRHPK